MLIWVLLLAWIGSVVIVVRSFPRATKVRRRLQTLSFMIIPWGLAIPRSFRDRPLRSACTSGNG
jgi:hypothetical protein